MTKFPQEEGNSYRPEPTGRPEDLALHVLHSLDLPLCIIDSRDCYLFANKAYAARFGIGPESMHGMPVKELIGESLYEKRIKVLFARAREEGTAEFHGWVDYPRQGRRFVESEISLYEHPGLIGQKCVMVQSRDCTDREEQDRRRRKSLVFQETLLARIPALIWIADKGGNPYFYNESWLNFTGKTLVEQVREGWLSEVHPEDRQMILDRIQYAMENQDRVQIEFRLRHLTGGYRWVRLNGVPMIQGEPSSAEFIAAAVEIDDNKKHQEKMRAALEEERYLRNQALVQKAAADRANREKSAYLSLASHEIRTPLNPVIGFADLLASNPHLDADSKEMAQMILKAGKTLLTLLDEVLDFAKIEAGVLSLAPEPMDVHDLLMEIDNLYSFDAKSRGIELRVNDQISDGEELYEDRLRLEQILGALVSHAIRYTHKGYVEVTAETERVPLTGSSIQMLKFTVNDTGIGLSEEEVSRLFKPFAHMESDFSDKYSGAGLGLAITQKLIEIMRGTVEVKSEVGKGTTVELVIPFSPVPEELRRDRKSGRKKGADAGEALRANTIIVDDEESSRLVNASLMRFLGYTCDMASDGNDLLEKLRHQSYKIILMDIMMPGLDGFEATRRIRNGECGERNREAFIIAVTGCVGDDDRERGLRAGINTYLNKPVTIKALKESIRDYYSLGYSV